MEIMTSQGLSAKLETGIVLNGGLIRLQNSRVVNKRKQLTLAA